MIQNQQPGEDARTAITELQKELDDIQKIFRFGEYLQIHERKRQRANLGVVVLPYSLNPTFVRFRTFCL